MRRGALVVLAVFLSAAAALYAQQSKPVPVESLFPKAPGRFMVTNPTPELARNAMLVDTATGDTWLLCGDTDGSSGWCRMFRSNDPSKRTAP